MHRPTWIWAAALAAVTQAAPSYADTAPLSAGTVTIELSAADNAPDQQKPLTDAVQAALSGANFIVLPGAGHGRYIARISIARHAQGSVTTRAVPDKPSWGTQATVNLPSSKRDMRDLVVTELTLTLVSRSDGADAWTARASTAQVDGTRDGDPAAVAGKLTAAVMARFPRASPGVISVP